MESPAPLPTHSLKRDLEGFHSSCLHLTSKALHIINLIRNSGLYCQPSLAFPQSTKSFPG